MAVAHNVPFTPISGHGHAYNHSLGSITSDITSKSTRPFGDGAPNAHLLGNNRRTIAPNNNTGAQHQPWHSPLVFRRKWSCRNWTTQTWRHATMGLAAAIICWVVYCTIRYFIAVKIYNEDRVRSRYALGMGITSAFTIIFFAGDSCVTLRFFNIHFDRPRRIIARSLAYLASALVFCLTIINLVLVFDWQTPHNPAQFGRSIQGRCRWDLDVVWSGTGMACAQDEVPFRGWLGAAIGRLIISVVLISAYHLTLRRHRTLRETRQTSTAVAEAEMGELLDCQPSIPASAPPGASPQTNDFNGYEPVPLPRSDSPGILPSDESLEPGELAQVSPPTRYLRTIAVPSNDLDELASVFRSLVLNVTQETQAGVTLGNTTRPLRPPRPTVRVLGSDISRMSTIDSLGSGEAGSAVRSPTRSDTAISSVSKNRSSRDRDESLPTPSTIDVGASEEPSPS